MAEKKFSRQREAVLSELKKRCDHPTANDIYMAVREEFPRISLGTVYRNISQLSDEGIVLKIRSGDGPDRFDGNFNSHYHFSCSLCDSVLDIQIPFNEKLTKETAKATGWSVDGHDTIFYGVCPKCEGKKEEKL